MKTYNIITIGCQMNKSDSERIVGLLEKNGYEQALRNKADLVILNTCGVRQSAEDRVYGLVPEIKKENPKAKIVIAGCLSEREDVKKRLGDRVDRWLPINQITNYLPRFAGKAGELRITNKFKVLKSKFQNCDYLKIKPKYQSEFSAFVPIGNGCDNFCAYCVVPYARGKEVYRPMEDILDEVRGLVKKGYKEIILIAQNVNSYNSRIKRELNASAYTPATADKNNREYRKGDKVLFPDLLRMVNDIEGDFWIRFATSHPKDMSDELIKTVAECSKICKHIHLPAQSGDNTVLKKMNRGYTSGEYKRLILRIRKYLTPSLSLPCRQAGLLRRECRSEAEAGEVWQPPVSITTDIIVGFPGETRKQFENTKKLFKEVKFDMAYIARYSPRPGTAAKKLMDDVPIEEKKRREEELMVILRKTVLENNKRYVGKVVEVLIGGMNKKGEWYGKTRTFKNVKCQNSNAKCKIGEFARVKIIRAEDFGIEGVLEI